MGMRVPRLILLILLGFGLAVLVLRQQAVRAPASHTLAKLAALFPDHPDMLRRDLEVRAASAALAGRPLSPEEIEKSRDLLRARPLATMPLMIAGAEAQLAGDAIRARRLYEAARTRNPRLPAARLLLADNYLRQGDVERGVQEVLALTRITPRSAGPATLALVEFARDPESARRLAAALRPYPDLRSGIVTQLARDPRNLPSILLLAPATAKERPWEGVLLNSLVSSGEYQQAFALWRRWAKVNYPPGVITNPTFQAWSAPPPFNWQILNSQGGLAEFRQDQGLAVVYYGRDNTIFARQLLLLKAGPRRIRTVVSTSDTGGIRWALRCVDGRVIEEWNVAETGIVKVPSDCPAQWLELIGRPLEMPTTREVVLSSVRLI